jgi:pilus assembly protein CpaB
MANASRLFALALFGIAGLLGLYAFTLSRPTPAQASVRAPAMVAAPAPSVAVIVAARDLEAGRALAAADLAVSMQPAMPAGAFANATALIGRVPVARIPAGGALTEGLFASGFTASIAPGERAVAIHVDENNAVSNLVKPGDAVDVFVVLKRDSAADGEIPASHARLLLSKVRVLGFGDSTIGSNDATGANLPGRASAARTAVLGVRVEDIDALTLAENSGRLMLALRNPADGDSAPALAATKNQSPLARAAAGVSLATLNGGVAAPAANVGGAGIASGGPLPPSMLAASAMVPPLPAGADAVTSRARKVASAAAGGIEVIRGSHSESVSNP